MFLNVHAIALFDLAVAAPFFRAVFAAKPHRAAESRDGIVRGAALAKDEKR